MSGFKQNALVISEKATPVAPVNTGEVTVVARDGELYKFDGTTESIIGSASSPRLDDINELGEYAAGIMAMGGNWMNIDGKSGVGLASLGSGIKFEETTGQLYLDSAVVGLKSDYGTYIPTFDISCDTSTIPANNVINYIPGVAQVRNFNVYSLLPANAVLQVISEEEAEGYVVYVKADITVKLYNNSTFIQDILADRYYKIEISFSSTIVTEVSYFYGVQAADNKVVIGQDPRLLNKQNNITLVAGSNVSITESPTDTWTISASGSSGTGFTPLAGNGISISGEGSDYRFYQSQDDMINVQEFTSNGTWTKPSGTWATVEVLVVAGGNGGSSGTGGTNTALLGGSGGSGGRIQYRTFLSSDITSPVSVTIGAGGYGGIAYDASSAPGGAGGDTSFGSFLSSSNASQITTGAGGIGATGASGNGPAGAWSFACGGGGAGGGPFTTQRLGGNGGGSYWGGAGGTSSGAAGSSSSNKWCGGGGAGGSSGRAATFTGSAGGAGGYPGGGGGGGGSWWGTGVNGYSGAAGANGYCLVITRR